MAVDNGHYDATEVILDSDCWQQALRSKIALKDGSIMTPMRRLMIKMPDMAKKVFSKCIQPYEDLTATTHGINDGNAAFKFNFEFVDDTFFAGDYSRFKNLDHSRMSRR